MKKVAAMLSGGAMALAALGAQASSYPTKEIQVVVNYGVGGVTDTATRLLAPLLEKELGQTIVVVNKPGGQATLGPSFVARQKPDGYTVGVVTYSAVAITPHLIDVPYTAKDFEFVGGYGRFRYGLAVQADSPYKTVKDFVEAGKKSDKPLFFGAPGAPNNIAFFDLAKMTGARLEQVLYKSGTESVMAVAGKQVEAAIQTPSEILPHVKSGKVRLLASVSPERWSDLPDMPTMKEAGYDVAIDSWMGLALPAGTPKDIVERLDKALANAMKDAKLIESLNNMGIDPVWMSGADYGKRLADGYVNTRASLEMSGVPLVPMKSN